MALAGSGSGVALFCTCVLAEHTILASLIVSQESSYSTTQGVAILFLYDVLVECLARMVKPATC